MSMETGPCRCASECNVPRILARHKNRASLYEIESLVSWVTGIDRREIYSVDLHIGSEEEAFIDRAVERMRAGEPLQYITSRVDFSGIQLGVKEGVFIPRPETEVLVDAVIDFSSKTNIKSPYILDLCTGSGNIALALARGIKRSTVVGIDISPDAIECAWNNAALYNMGKRVRFLQGDISEALGGGKRLLDNRRLFDIIVCNPPYIAEKELAALQEEVKKEPYTALNGGQDGLRFYRMIAEGAHRLIKKGASLFLEIGAGQSEAVRDIFKAAGVYAVKGFFRDFHGIERVAWISLL